MRKISKKIRIISLVLFLGLLLLVGTAKIKKTNEAKTAKIFYENHYHKVLRAAHGNNLDMYLEEQNDKEIIVYLSNLVVYNSKEMVEILKEMPCNLSKSKLIIKPKAPYGPKDYSYIVNCVEP